MKTVLLISSFVSSSQVGANISAFTLRRLGHDVVILPTTLFGRHPGWGPPGGQATPPNILDEMWTGIQAQNIKFDAVMTGYMAHKDHVRLSIDIMAELRAKRPDITVLIDPVKGDHGQLYIPQDRAELMAHQLSPLADILTPNLYELSFLCGEQLSHIDDIIKAVRAIGTDMLVTSVPYKGMIGALWVTKDTASYVGHENYPNVPNGGGDMLAATYLAHRLNGDNNETAQSKAVSATYDILTHAVKNDLPELPLTRYQEALTRPNLLDIVTFPYD